MDCHTMDFYEHTYLGLKQRYIIDTPVNIVR